MNEMGDELVLPIRQGFVDFYDEAPEQWRPSLKWNPSPELRGQIRRQQSAAGDGENSDVEP